MSYDRAAVKEILDKALAEGRNALSAPEAKQVADAYGIPTPGEGLAKSAEETAEIVGASPGAVRVAQHRALTRLRKNIPPGLGEAHG